jgi:hypothetical protein
MVLYWVPASLVNDSKTACLPGQDSDPGLLPRIDCCVAGVDFGFHNPSAMVLGCQDHDDVLWIVQEVYQARMTHDELIHISRRILSPPAIVGGGDPPRHREGCCGAPVFPRWRIYYLEGLW